uniref:PH domain-containing protein n=1 Tax=Angiostrongylus cantonensis TaxID=6313 RepID=A0A0K0CV12_ANGCA
MEKVLDIDNIFGDVGFMAPSRDGGEETTQICRTKRELSSRLATIFADDNAIVPSTTSPGAAHYLETKKNSGLTPSETIFSSVAYLYLSQNGQYISKGRVGVAIVRSNPLIFLVFYNSNKENLLCVTLRDGSIQKIDKQEKYCTVRTALKTFSFVCLNDDDEAKLIALLMILCSIKSIVLEVGTGNEVEMGSSIFYSSTKFTFDGTSIEVVAQQPSKHRVSMKSDSWMLSLLGLKRSATRLTLLDDKTALAIHASLHSEKNIARDTLGKRMDMLEKSTLGEDNEQRNADLQSDKSDQLLTDYSALHRIVGVEIDRLKAAYRWRWNEWLTAA